MIDATNCSRDELLAELPHYRRFCVKTADGSYIQVSLKYLRDWVNQTAHASRRYSFESSHEMYVGFVISITTAN